MQWIIDRIEDGKIAVLENPDTEETKELPRAKLPKGAKEGHVLIEDGDGLRIDQAETDARKARIRERFKALQRG